MRKNLFSLVAAVILTAGAAEVFAVPQYRPIEIILTSAVKRENPYAEIELDALFTSPSGRTFRQAAFWDGGQIWKIRFAPAELGRWSYRTLCTDANDSGLHEKSGTFDCTKNSGNTIFDRHGDMRISADHRYFVHADGTPFFWLGDTHWMGIDTESINSCNHPDHAGGTCPFGGVFQHIVAERKKAGFTVYQTYPRVRNSQWLAPRRTDLVDPERFQQVFDPMIEHLASQGMLIALGVGHYTASVNMPEADLCRWARYLVARYGAYPVVWITCQEMNSPPTQRDKETNRQVVWEKVAAEIDRANGMRRLHSAHQWVLEPDVRPVWHLPWHNWFALQGGHAGSGLKSQSYYRSYYDCRPTRPILETEAMYERVYCGGFADTDLTRRSAWRALLCGCSGYTYGAAGIWALKKSPDDPAWQKYNQEIAGWYDGLKLPGANEMQILGEFFRTIAWEKLKPSFGDPDLVDFADPEKCVLATIGNELYLAYIDGEQAAGELRGMDPAGCYSATWFDPRTGKKQIVAAAFEPKSGKWSIPERPDCNDYLLVVEKIEKNAD